MLTHEQAKMLQNKFDNNVFSITHDQTVALDAYVRRFALAKFCEVMKQEVKDPSLSNFLVCVVNAHYGSVDVDDLLQHFKCYPDFVG